MASPLRSDTSSIVQQSSTSSSSETSNISDSTIETHGGNPAEFKGMDALKTSKNLEFSSQLPMGQGGNALALAAKKPLPRPPPRPASQEAGASATSSSRPITFTLSSASTSTRVDSTRADSTSNSSSNSKTDTTKKSTSFFSTNGGLISKSTSAFRTATQSVKKGIRTSSEGFSKISKSMKEKMGELTQARSASKAAKNQKPRKFTSDEMTAKWSSASEKAKLVGKGLVEAEKRGMKGIVLDEEYWKEATIEEHPAGYTQEMTDLFTEWKTGEGHLESNFKDWVLNKLGDKGAEFFTKNTTAARDDYSGGLYFRPTNVQYNNSEQMQAKHVSFEGGRATQNGEILTQRPRPNFYEPEPESIFVLSPDGKIYQDYAEEGSLHHSSLLSGGAVLAAGNMKFVDGQVTEISNMSGHYKPGEVTLIHTLKALEQQGVNTYNIVINTRGTHGPNPKMTSQDFLAGTKEIKTASNLETLQLIGYLGRHGADLGSLQLDVAGERDNVSSFARSITDLNNVSDPVMLREAIQTLKGLESVGFKFSQLKTITTPLGMTTTQLLREIKAVEPDFDATNISFRILGHEPKV